MTGIQKIARPAILALTAAMLLQAFPSTASAACSTDSSTLEGQLYKAIYDATHNPNSRDTSQNIFLSANTYRLTSAGCSLEINGPVSITIWGKGTNVTKIDGAGINQVFSVGTGSHLKLQQLTVTGGWTTVAGGGIENFGSVDLSSSEISGNTAFMGGGIMNWGTLNGDGSFIINNTALNGGGIANGGNVKLTGCLVSGNAAYTAGGGIYNHAGSNGTVTLEKGTLVWRNKAQGDDGIFNIGSMALTSSEASYNTATTGGGISNYTGTLTLDKSFVGTNTDRSVVGGIFNPGTVVLDDKSFLRRTFPNTPDDIYNDNSSGRSGTIRGLARLAPIFIKEFERK